MLTHQRQASQLSLYSLWEWSTCMFPYQTAWLWTVSVKCLRASVCWWTAMFFQSRTDADHLEVLDQNATDGQIWVSDQVASTPQLWKQHLWQVPDDMAEWCHHQRMPILAEVDQLPEGDLGGVVKCVSKRKRELSYIHLMQQSIKKDFMKQIQQMFTFTDFVLTLEEQVWLWVTCTAVC